MRKKQTLPPNASDILYKVILTCLHNWLWQLSDMIPNHKKMLQVLLEKACLGKLILAKCQNHVQKGPSLPIHGSLQR